MDVSHIVSPPPPDRGHRDVVPTIEFLHTRERGSPGLKTPTRSRSTLRTDDRQLEGHHAFTGRPQRPQAPRTTKIQGQHVQHTETSQALRSTPHNDAL